MVEDSAKKNRADSKKGILNGNKIASGLGSWNTVPTDRSQY
jgi:hypothetical protein